MTQTTVAVLGAGSWGTALALLLHRNGHAVTLWDHSPAHLARLREQGENRRYLPGIALPPEIQLESDLAHAVAWAETALLVVPSHAFAELVARLAPLLRAGTGIAWATKGFDPATGGLLHEVAATSLPGRPLAAVSGPSFAMEVARGLPTAVTVASPSAHHAQHVASLLHSERFRAYTSDDLIGVQVGGATKNVLAIASGIADGLAFGANTRAALITRGLAEIIRLGTRLGGRLETFTGLAGLGDLVLTCTDDQSRNRRLGLALAGGATLETARATIGQEIEGLITARTVVRLAAEVGVEMPISEQVHRVLFDGLTPAAAAHNLLIRRSKSEH